MPQIKILNKKENQEIVNKLKKQFGISNLNGILVKYGPEKIFLYQGSFSEQEIKKLERIVPVERIGIYFAKIQNNQIRLSIEATQILQEQINKNIFELDDEQVENWMMGQELDVQTGKKDFLIMKYQNDFLGCGKASEKKIGNYIPKNRRLRIKG